MSNSNTSELIVEEFVIQGVLKELLVAEASFEITGTETLYRIIDITESKIRGKSEGKKLLLRPLNNKNLLALITTEGTRQFKVGFYRSQITFESAVLEIIAGGDIKVEIPDSLESKNFRKQERNHVKTKLRQTVPFLIQTNGYHCEGTFLIEDTSTEGFGGILHIPTGFPLNVTSTVIGEIILGTGELSVRGKIARAVKLPEEQTDFDSFRIGILQANQNLNSNPDNKERRKGRRHFTKQRVFLTPLIHPDFKFSFDLDDISISGFSGRLSPGAVVPCLPIGTRFTLDDTETQAQLMYFDDDLLRFSITSRNEKESINWLRRMTPLIFPGATCSVRDARDLYKIFLQAGAISSQYLKRHAFYKDSLTANPEEFSDESGYLHRWYAGNKAGEIEAHVSAVRISDNCWFIGDIAKTAKSTVKAEPFIKHFFHSFSSLCLSISPCPSLMGMWTHDHPLWKRWNQKIKEQTQECVISSVFLDYTRLTIEKSVNKDDSTVKVEEISPHNYKVVRYIQEKLKNVGVENFAKYGFDFDYSNFASPRLRQAIQNKFDRRYFLLSQEERNFLAITTKYPNATSFNRVADSIFLFGLDSETLDSATKKAIHNKCYELSLSIGIDAPAIRTVYAETTNPLEIEGAMQCYILTPKGFELFEGFK
jgi:hypothetical protein